MRAAGARRWPSSCARSPRAEGILSVGDTLQFEVQNTWPGKTVHVIHDRRVSLIDRNVADFRGADAELQTHAEMFDEIETVRPSLIAFATIDAAGDLYMHTADRRAAVELGDFSTQIWHKRYGLCGGVDFIRI